MPYIDLKTEYYDLGLLEDRDGNERPASPSTSARTATKKYGVAVKCATITPNAQRVEEYQLNGDVEEPQRHASAQSAGRHGVPRADPGPTASSRLCTTWKKPITIARHAYGDIYKAAEYGVPREGASAELVVHG